MSILSWGWLSRVFLFLDRISLKANLREVASETTREVTAEAGKNREVQKVHFIIII